MMVTGRAWALVVTAVAAVVPVTLVAPALVAPQGLQIEPNPENVTGSRLEGAWVLDETLAERLLGSRSSSVSVRAATFRPDATVVERIPARYGEFLRDKTIYQAGILTGLAQEAPYVLIGLNGSPHLVFFRAAGGVPMADTESFNLFVVRAEERENDLLFVGGDFNNQAFTPFRRHVPDRVPETRR